MCSTRKAIHKCSRQQYSIAVKAITPFRPVNTLEAHDMYSSKHRACRKEQKGVCKTKFIGLCLTEQYTINTKIRIVLLYVTIKRFLSLYMCSLCTALSIILHAIAVHAKEKAVKLWQTRFLLHPSAKREYYIFTISTQRTKTTLASRQHKYLFLHLEGLMHFKRSLAPKAIV